MASTHKQVLQFEWDQDKKEDAQATNYLGWLKANIKVPKNTEFYNTSLKPNLLNTELEGLKIRGTSDVALVSSASAESPLVATGMIVGFELKKAVEDHHIYQAILQLLTGDPMSEYEFTCCDFSNPVTGYY